MLGKGIGGDQRIAILGQFKDKGAVGIEINQTVFNFIMTIVHQPILARSALLAIKCNGFRAAIFLPHNNCSGNFIVPALLTSIEGNPNKPKAQRYQ